MRNIFLKNINLLHQIINKISVSIYEPDDCRELKYIVYIGIFGICCFIAVGVIVFSIFHGF